MDIAALIGPIIWVIIIVRVVASLAKSAQKQQTKHAPRNDTLGRPQVTPAAPRGPRPVRPRTRALPSGQPGTMPIPMYVPARASMKPRVGSSSSDATLDPRNPPTSRPVDYEYSEGTGDSSMAYVSPEGACDEHPEHDRAMPPADSFPTDDPELNLSLSGDALVNAVVWSEILAKPKGLRCARVRS